MALLRKCLQELRLRQGTQPTFLLDAHALSWAWTTSNCVLTPPFAFDPPAEALTHSVDTAVTASTGKSSGVFHEQSHL